MTKRKIEYWVIPPEQDAEFVACMEEVLETYAQAYDPQQPVLCMDEQPVQLLKETRVPIPPTKEHGERVDYEYERNGTASIFMFAEPLSGFRQATARPRRTKDDWAHEVAHLLDTRYAGVERITLVCDNLNTHTKGAFYEALAPDQARSILTGRTAKYGGTTLLVTVLFLAALIAVYALGYMKDFLVVGKKNILQKWLWKKQRMIYLKHSR